MRSRERVLPPLIRDDVIFNEHEFGKGKSTSESELESTEETVAEI